MKKEKVVITASVDFLLDIPRVDITAALAALNATLTSKAQEIMEADNKIETCAVKKLDVRLTY